MANTRAIRNRHHSSDWAANQYNDTTPTQHYPTSAHFDDQWIASFSGQPPSVSSDNAFQGYVSNALGLSNHLEMGHSNAHPTVLAYPTAYASSSDLENQCLCIICVKLNFSNEGFSGCLCTRCFLKTYYSFLYRKHHTSYRKHGCQEKHGCHEKHCTFRETPWPAQWLDHYVRHLFNSGKYHCDSANCSKSFKRYSDLLRHASSTHCINPQKFPCTFPGCERGGDNGFPRKDKLTSHYNNKHRRVAVAPSRPRNIAPRS